jgi:flagellar hook-basal body complex protein FliE
MTIRIADAISAYANAAKAPAAKLDEAAPAGAGENFASVLKSVASEAIEQNHQAEELSKSAIAGKADLREVVLAVNNAELTLETVVAVRDKVINAYNDILRMPI